MTPSSYSFFLWKVGNLGSKERGLGRFPPDVLRQTGVGEQLPLRRVLAWGRRRTSDKGRLEVALRMRPGSHCHFWSGGPVREQTRNASCRPQARAGVLAPSLIHSVTPGRSPALPGPVPPHEE